MDEKGTPDLRLASIISAWAQDEIEAGFKVDTSSWAWVVFEIDGRRHRCVHSAVCCGGEAPQGTSLTNWQPTIEQAARHLIHQVRMMMEMRGVTLETHRLVWRSVPYIGQESAGGGYISQWNAYCRFSFVPLKATIILEDGE